MITFDVFAIRTNWTLEKDFLHACFVGWGCCLHIQLKEQYALWDKTDEGCSFQYV
jgi:hypothetical protein